MDYTIILTIVGIVVAVIIGIWQIQLARKQINLSKRETKSSPKSQENVGLENKSQLQPNNITIEKSPYRERPYPKEILDEVSGLPPFQKEEVLKTYNGLKVKWRTTFQNFVRGEKNLVTLMMKDRGQYPWVYCTVNLSEYPELKITKEGHGLWVEGEIALSPSGEIFLSKCKITLD